MKETLVGKNLIKAKSFAKQGNYDEAYKIYKLILNYYPKNKIAIYGLNDLTKINKNNSKNKKISQDIINHLFNLYNVGKFELVIEKIFILKKQYPNEFILMNLLGGVYVSLGKLYEAELAFKEVTYLNPKYIDGYSNLGSVLNLLGKYDESIKAYEQVLSINMNEPEAYFNIGNVFKNKMNFKEAIASYKKAISIKSDYVEAYNNLGIILQKQGKVEDAIVVYNKAYSMKPNYVALLNNLGRAYEELEKFTHAIDYFKKILSIQPKNYQSLKSLGNIFIKQGEFDNALHCLKSAINFNDPDPELYNNIGVIYKTKLDFESAINYFNKAISLRKNYYEACYNKANTLQNQKKTQLAIEVYKEVLLLKPNYELAKSQKLHQEAILCKWEDIYESKDDLAVLGTKEQIIDPFTVLSFEDEPQKHRLRSEIYSKSKYSRNILPFSKGALSKSKKLRIGYFSADFTEHPVAHLLVRILELHDREKFEIYAYSYGPNRNDHMRKRIVKGVDIFKDIEKISDKDVAYLAREDQLDIAIDLTGHTNNSRHGIFAYRAAPLQINYLGYPGTTGSNFIDYLIADTKLIPVDLKSYYSEKIIYLPNTYMATDNTRKFSNINISRSAMGLPNDKFVFCCFNNNYKITPKEFNIWMSLLKKIDKSILWLKKSNIIAENNLKKEANKRNIDPSRLYFADIVSMEEHLSRHKLADLYLDTFSFNAHTSASEALWAGLPVVTKIGKSFSARVAGSLLNAIGLEELITETAEEYETVIYELATNPKKLRHIREKLKNNRLSRPLFNSELFVKHLENGFMQAYQNHIDGHKPKDLYVNNDL